MTPQSFASDETAFQVLKEFALILRVCGRDAQGSTEVLNLQRALDLQDDKPGLAGVYVERGEQAYASYGGIESCSLSGDELVLIMDDEGAEELGGIKQWRFKLSFDLSERRALAEALTFIFRGCDCLRVEA